MIGLGVLGVALVALCIALALLSLADLLAYFDSRKISEESSKEVGNRSRYLYCKHREAREASNNTRR